MQVWRASTLFRVGLQICGQLDEPRYVVGVLVASLLLFTLLQFDFDEIRSRL